MLFELHPNLAKKILLADLPLCRVLLEDERNYPWLLLVPRKANVKRLIDLSLEEQMEVMKELQLVQEILWENCQPTQLNVAAIGNKTPQLHIHVIARYADDPAWPGTVWDHPVRNPYADDEKKNMIEKMKKQIAAKLGKIG